MLIPQTEHVTRGCAQCRKVIPAGVKYYFDMLTRDRYHVECKPREIVVAMMPTPAAKVEVKNGIGKEE